MSPSSPIGRVTEARTGHPGHTTARSLSLISLTTAWLAGCQCADVAEPESESSSSSSEGIPTGHSDSSGSSTGAPFDASRWIGRYHFESTFLPFGERGDPHGSRALINFEILPDSRATMLYDDCSFDEAITIAYEWLPFAEGWLSLHPGEGETSLRYLGREDVDTLRVRLIEPCRELEFEIDGEPDGGFHVVRPGESWWVDRCTESGIMQVDYCEGEEPSPCP